jgi:glycosyltransferase involved in cell wall biosynthesis
VRDLGLEEHVLFQNRFVELHELCEYLGAADIYLTPYLNPAQIVSGTLAYAMGLGKAVVSTPYWYAEDMLADDRGRLVPFRDSEAIAEVVVDLLRHENERHAMRKRSTIRV